jgi:Ribbon-helix-helix protein, copG family
MKTKMLQVRLTEFEFKQLEKEAQKRNMSKSELIRSLMARFELPG